MEYWVLEADDVPDLIWFGLFDIKSDLIPLNPVFQHSIIPVPRFIYLQYSL